MSARPSDRLIEYILLAAVSRGKPRVLQRKLHNSAECGAKSTKSECVSDETQTMRAEGDLLGKRNA